MRFKRGKRIAYDFIFCQSVFCVSRRRVLFRNHIRQILGDELVAQARAVAEGRAKLS